MKKLILSFILSSMMSLSLSAQKTLHVDEIAPFFEDMAAVRKGNQWGFINTNGELVIDYRSDLAMNDGERYPIFNSGRCLIKLRKNGIYYYGYIDKKGQEVIPPTFLNAQEFSDGYAIVIKLEKKDLGQNDLFDKPVVKYTYDEVVIDTNGKAVVYLNGPFSLTFSKENLNTPPAITSYLMSGHIAVQKKNDGSIRVHTLN